MKRRHSSYLPPKFQQLPQGFTKIQKRVTSNEKKPQENIAGAKKSYLITDSGSVLNGGIEE